MARGGAAGSPGVGGEWDLLFGDQDTAQAKASALAQALRGQQAQGLIGALSGDKVLGPVGQALQQNAQQGIAGIGQAAQARMGNEIQKQRFDQLGQQFRDAFASKGATLEERTRHDKAMEARPPGAGSRALGAPDDVKQIADAIESGQQPPETKGLYRLGAPVKAELGRRGFDLSTASTDWAATQKHVAALNGPQQTRLRQSVQASTDQLDVVEGLYNEWAKLGPASGFKVLNRAALGAAKQMGGPAGAAAQALEGQLSLLTGEIGNTLMGGNSPTDHALALSRTMLSGDWDEPTFKQSLGNLRRDLRIRSNSLAHSTAAGTSSGNLYGGKAPPPSAEAGAVVEVKTPEEARALAPGTRFKTPDGREFTR